MSWIRWHYSKRKKVRKGLKEFFLKRSKNTCRTMKTKFRLRLFFFLRDLVLGKKISDRSLKTDSDSVIQTAGGNSFHHLGARTETWVLINVFLAPWGTVGPVQCEVWSIPSGNWGFISGGPSIRALKPACVLEQGQRWGNKKHEKTENKLRLGINLNDQIELAI